MVAARAAALRPAQGAGRLRAACRPHTTGGQLAARPAHGPRLPLRPGRACQPPTATFSAAAAAPGPTPNGGSGQQQQKPAAEPPPPPLSALDPPPVQLTGARSTASMPGRGSRNAQGGRMGFLGATALAAHGRASSGTVGPVALVGSWRARVHPAVLHRCLTSACCGQQPWPCTCAFTAALLLSATKHLAG